MAGPSLPANWGQYLATTPSSMLNPDSAGAQQALAWVRQYDPNASYQGSAIDMGSGNTQQGYTLSYNNSLLPQNVTGQSGISGINNLGALADQQYYRGPAPQQDPIYGRVGDSRGQFADPTSMVDILGPLVVGGAIGLGGGFSMLGNIMSKLPNVASTLSGMLGGNQGVPYGNNMPQQQQITPQQLMMLRLMAAQGGGGGM